jgi:hypothetical protein
MSLSAQKPQLTGGNYTPKYGIVPFKVALINPTMEELNKFLGRDFLAATPTYITDEGQNILEFWSEDQKNVRFYFKNEPAVSQSGKQQYINGCGNGTFFTAQEIASNPKMSTWYETTTMRPAMIGECDIMTFMATQMNLYTRWTSEAPDAKAHYFLDMSNLVTGCRQDFESGAMYLGNLMYQGISEYNGKYRELVFPKWSMNVKANILNNITRLENVLTGQYGFKKNVAPLNLSLELKGFDTTSTDNSNVEAAVKEIKTDDLPF